METCVYLLLIIGNTFSSYIHMRLGNCLGSCDRYLKCHSAQTVSYKASQKLGNLTDQRVIGSSAIVPVTICCEATEQCLPNDGLYYIFC